jgi:hypothetical protein
MKVLSMILLAVLVAASLVPAPDSARQRIDPSGMLDQVVVVAQLPDHLRGTMPEVVVEAQMPEHARGLMPEVAVVADGPAAMLDEVVAVEQAPDTEPAHDARIALHKAGSKPERIN